jgi:hypothetical protein
MKTYTKLGYKLTNDKSFCDKELTMDQQLRDQLPVLHRRAKDKQDTTIISALKQQMRAHPGILLLKSDLGAAYHTKGMLDKSRKVYEQLVAEYPDYLQGWIGLFSAFLEEQAYDKIEELAGADVDIRTLFPEREVFHLDEVSDFLRFAILYFIATGQIEKAEARRRDLKTINSAYPDLPLLSARINSAGLKKRLAGKEGEVENIRDLLPQKRAELSDYMSAPVFHHEEINDLYLYDFEIPEEILQEILQLPRASLIADLEKVLDDAVDRYAYFSLQDSPAAENCFFATHAFFLLAELGAKKSLTKVLDILSYDDDFLEFWFEDFLSEEMWIYFYKIGFSQLNEIKDFLFNPAVNASAKRCITDAIVQTALHHPKKREEMIEIYASVMDYYLDLPANIEPEFVNFLVKGALEGGFKSLLPQIRELYNRGYVDLIFVRNYKDVLSRMNWWLGDRKSVMDIYAIYQYATDIADESFLDYLWGYYDDDFDYDDDDDDDDDDDFDDDDDDFDDDDDDFDDDDYDDGPIRPFVSVKTGKE